MVTAAPGSATRPDGAPLLEVSDLSVAFRTRAGTVRAVDEVSFAVTAGRTVGLVGESGSGKTVTAMSIMRLIPEPPGQIAGGSIRLRGRELLDLTRDEIRSVRGNQISMIFQEPMSSLNPVLTVGEQIAEAIRLHRGVKRRRANELAVEMLGLVGIPSPEERTRAYPHQMSGGMRQRVMIAMALACEPELLIADEPTTALDVTIQAQILELLSRLQEELGMSVLLITHDLGIVAETCDEVVVMYAGRVVERATVENLFEHPLHPYTAGLLRAVPGHEGDRPRSRLFEIPGMVPSLLATPSGCRFADRCSHRQSTCSESEPELVAIGDRSVRCHFPLEGPNE